MYRDTNVVWENIENPILVKNYQNSPGIWWERSPDPNSSAYFQDVSSGGRPYRSDYAGYSDGVVPGFCL